jgi:hypothetical protein
VRATLTRLFYHNVAGFLTKMAVESEKKWARTPGVRPALPPQPQMTHCHVMRD